MKKSSNQITNSPFIFTAHDYWQYLASHGRLPQTAAPHTMILAIGGAEPSRWRRRFWHKTVSGFTADILLYRESNWQIGHASRFGIGGPALVNLMEMLTVWGVKRFILMGSAGSMQPHISAGQIIMPTAALGEDGVSHLYTNTEPTQKQTPRDSQLIDGLKQVLSTIAPIHTGEVWSTAAPFRESLHDVKKHIKAGRLAVDMETAALFAASRVLGVETAAVLVASDSITDGHWQPAKQPNTIRQTLAKIERKLTHIH